MADLYIVATMTAAADHAPQLKSLLVPAVAEFRQEDGCFAYTLLEDQKKAGRFVTYERWRDAAALEAHMTSTAMKALEPKLKGLLTESLTQDFLTALKIL
jgi:quinol monooxygenase YgiN